jgi:nucleotide-binding universal stress UspA family protein
MISNTMTAVSNVLLATDFSDESVQAVDWARGVSEWYGAKLHVAHVMDLFPFSLRTDSEANMRIEQIRQTADTQMKAFVRNSHLEGKHFETALLAGEPFAAIEKFAVEREIDLIVLGSKGDIGLARLFEGSVAEEIFRTARCPVMVVGPSAKARAGLERFSKLIFATDLSRISRNAVPFIEFLLSKNASATLTLAHFLDELDTNVFTRHQTRARIERELAEMISPDFRHRIAGVAVEVCPPGEGMLTLAEGLMADLLVLGVRSGGAFTRAATHGLCSIAPRVISEARCPVLTIRGE